MVLSRCPGTAQGIALSYHSINRVYRAGRRGHPYHTVLTLYNIHNVRPLHQRGTCCVRQEASSFLDIPAAPFFAYRQAVTIHAPGLHSLASVSRGWYTPVLIPLPAKQKFVKTPISHDGNSSSPHKLFKTSSATLHTPHMPAMESSQLHLGT